VLSGAWQTARNCWTVFHWISQIVCEYEKRTICSHVKNKKKIFKGRQPTYKDELHFVYEILPKMFRCKLAHQNSVK
jgi:hypothetical protein